MASSAAGRGRKEPIWATVISQRPGVPGVEDLLEARRIPLAVVDPNPDQPRRGELPDIPELAAHIAEYGLLQPVVVTPPHSGRYTLIAGARRLAAFRHLWQTHPEPGRWATIPALERETDTADRLVLALAENLARHNLSDADTITSLRVLRDLRGWSGAEIARRLGTSREWIYRHFSVAGDPQLAEQVQTHRLSVAKAYEVVLAKTPQARGAALGVALEGAPLRVIRGVAKERSAPAGFREAQGPEEPKEGRAADHQGPTSSTESAGAGGRGHDAPDVEAEMRSDYARSPVATAAPDAAAYDLAELAAELGVTTTLGDLQIVKLVRSALEAGTVAVDAAAVLRLLRADLRQVEAVVRAAAVRERR